MTTSELHDRPAGEPARRRFGDRYVIAADRVFDGTRVLEHHAVAVRGDRIAAVAPADRLFGPGQLVRFAGTVLPGFIDLHGHPLLGQVPPETILRHGITTIRDTGGALVPPSGGDGRLRVLGAGPILTAPGGYPIPVFGPGAGVEVPDVQTARTAVGQLVAGGAALIKIALEPGGSPGAPWTGHQLGSPPPWPIPSLEVVRAIVEEAHAHGRIVSVHLSGPEGARLALDAGVDEWAHVPCDAISPDLVARAAAAGVRVVSALDTQSHCTGVADNASQLVQAGIRLLYGTDLGHTDVPWGIDAQELQLMLHAAHGALTPLEVLSAATARAGEHVGLAPLGRLVEGAPADLIGVRGNPLEQFKLLEYPDLVVSGGATIVDPVE
ncbi:MAG TPA: amidohydrolase family protein [Actinomycetota bacterium]|nr:amidohydrolase family protein [Actinomycetota bacterium]